MRRIEKGMKVTSIRTGEKGFVIEQTDWLSYVSVRDDNNQIKCLVFPDSHLKERETDIEEIAEFIGA